MKRGIRDAVSRRIGPGPRHQRGVALDAVDLGDLQRKRQAEIAEPAEQVERAVAVGCGVQQSKSRASTISAFELAVDLHEIGRRELDARGQAGQL